MRWLGSRLSRVRHHKWLHGHWRLDHDYPSRAPAAHPVHAGFTKSEPDPHFVARHHDDDSNDLGAPRQFQRELPEYRMERRDIGTYRPCVLELLGQALVDDLGPSVTTPLLQTYPRAIRGHAGFPPPPGPAQRCLHQQNSDHTQNLLSKTALVLPLPPLPSMAATAMAGTDPPRDPELEYPSKRPLGKGRDAVVYEARRQGEERAVKVAVPGAGSLLEHEAKVLRTLQGIRGIPELKKQHLEGALPHYIELELAGKNLHEWQPLGEEALAAVGVELINCLEKIHGSGIVHCDIKPANIVATTNEGGVRLVDFAIARGPRLSEGDNEGVEQGSTRFSSYRAMENPSSERLPIDDLWSLLYTMAAASGKRLSWSEEKDRSKSAVNNPQESRLLHSRVLEKKKAAAADPSALLEKGEVLPGPVSRLAGELSAIYTEAGKFSRNVYTRLRRAILGGDGRPPPSLPWRGTSLEGGVWPRSTPQRVMAMLSEVACPRAGTSHQAERQLQEWLQDRLAENPKACLRAVSAAVLGIGASQTSSRAVALSSADAAESLMELSTQY